MQKKSISWLFFAAGFCLVLLGITPKAHAISAFSREYNTECTTCHTIFPELNEYGDVFLKNGFVWSKQNKDGSAGSADKMSEVKGEGDPEILNKLKAQSALSAPQEVPAPAGPKRIEQIWISGLPQTVPFSMAASLNASYRDDSSNDKVDFSTRALSLLSGGVFQDKVGFYLKYNLYSEGLYDPGASNTPVNLPPPQANDLEEFYLVWRNTFGSPVNLKIGRFRPQLSLWKKTNKTGISDLATTHLSIKNSTFTVDSPEDALEASAVLFNRLYLAGGLVDRNGQDNNEGYGHISVKVGGSDFHAKEPDIDLEKESIFDYMYLVVGAYAYSGRNSGTLTSNQRNNFFRGGVEMDLVVMNARLKFAWAKLRDSNPDFSSHRVEFTDIYAVQGDYMLRTDIIAFCRYEYLEMNDGEVYKRYIPAISYSPIQNTKLTLEYQHVDSRRSSVNNGSDIALLGIRVAF